MGKIYLPPQVGYVIKKLENAGYEAYAVGGCVRDHLMGRQPGDYDVTTSATPDEMLKVFSGDRVIETGLKHGTLTVLREGMPIETTTYRIDGSYADGRHPDKVTFTPELRLDLCRRDFTVNAMAYSENKGIIDLFGGKEDLENRIIRCVGSADERFNEDGLRILRAMRFASVLDFELDGECEDSVRRLRHLLGRISRERIYTEMTKLLSGKGAGRILASFPEVISFIFPSLTREMIIHASEVIGNCPFDTEMRYAVLFSELSEGDAARMIDSLKPSRAEKGAVMRYHRYKDSCDYLAGEYEMCSLISKTDDDFILSLARMQAGCGKITSGEYLSAEKIYDAIKKRCAPRHLSDLAVDGRKLIELGYSGADIGQELTLLLDGVMRGEIQNTENELIKKAENDLKLK